MSIYIVDLDEIHTLRAIWQDLSDRSGGKGIDKETFLQYFPLNGLLGGQNYKPSYVTYTILCCLTIYYMYVDRLFAQFDIKGNGFIDFDEFVTNLAMICRYIYT